MVSATPPSVTSGSSSNGSPHADLAAWQAGDIRPLLSWSLGRRHAVFLVTPTLALLDMNRAAAAMLETDGEIQIVSGQFGFVDKTRTSELREFLDAGETGTAGWSYGRAGGDVAIIHVEWLGEAEPEGAGPLVALTFCPVALDQRYVWADFAPWFDLTRSEAAIVRMLIGGQTPTEVAAVLGLSIETVRTHIRRTYNKLGISSREQLFSLVAPFRIG